MSVQEALLRAICDGGSPQGVSDRELFAGARAMFHYGNGPYETEMSPIAIAALSGAVAEFSKGQFRIEADEDTGQHMQQDLVRIDQNTAERQSFSFSPYANCIFFKSMQTTEVLPDS